MSAKPTETPIQIDDTEFRNHIKATEFDKIRQKLETLGFDVSNSTHADITSLLDDLVSTGPNAVAMKAASEAIALKNKLQAQIKAFQDDMDKARAEIYQTLSDLKGIQDVDRISKDVDLLKANSNMTMVQTRQLTGNESFAFMNLIRELSVIDSAYLYGNDTVKQSIQSTMLSQKSQEVLRWLGMCLKRMERNENWGNW